MNDRTRLTIGVLLSVPAAVWTRGMLVDTPPPILASALVPAAVLTAVILLAQRKVRVINQNFLD